MEWVVEIHSLEGRYQSIKRVYSAEETPEIDISLFDDTFYQADSLDELREITKDAVDCNFEEDEKPDILRLHIVRQEVLTV
ncbi:hypothetical protein Asulf_02040 [Archaeoglobus sulfaticallidus PM70-1]|uniref:Uncharacterized protein n=1 Tax=Archaeoglobus sulfaticallidus PM70-1 TaxID=387631 RepID=N0BGA2_9EURY|nr:hypothetical protein [Archaeoglobus sulfaticallidus]AGK62003.1 hypothetical protein Asulf_02040 [Archaeoglobus sulfaticallidus PM70-1]